MRQKTAEEKGKQSKEAIKIYNIFLTGHVDWLEGYCTFLPFYAKCYPRPYTSAFSEDASNKFSLLRTVPRPQYLEYVLSLLCKLVPSVPFSTTLHQVE